MCVHITWWGQGVRWGEEADPFDNMCYHQNIKIKKRQSVMPLSHFFIIC